MSQKKICVSSGTNKPFNALPISTQTVMAYINCSFNKENLFELLPAENVTEKEFILISRGKMKGEHGKFYRLKLGKKVRGAPTKQGNFRNQLTVCPYIYDKIVTIKIFPTGKLHLTGCKTTQHRQEAVIVLLNHIRLCHTEDVPTYTISDDQPLNAILEVVMVNVDFHLGFDIDQEKLDRLFQSNNEFYTVYETEQPSVNIKLDYPDPDLKQYTKIIIDGEINNPIIKYETVNECPKAKAANTRTHTFLVFSSSKVIQSGRYYDSEMEPAYKKFREFIIKNRSKIELKLSEKKFDMSKLKGINKK